MCRSASIASPSLNGLWIVSPVFELVSGWVVAVVVAVMVVGRFWVAMFWGGLEGLEDDGKLVDFGRKA